MGQNKKPGHHNGRCPAQMSTLEIEHVWARLEAPVCTPLQGLGPRTRGEAPSRMNPAVASELPFRAGVCRERKTDRKPWARHQAAQI